MLPSFLVGSLVGSCTFASHQGHLSPQQQCQHGHRRRYPQRDVHRSDLIDSLSFRPVRESDVSKCYEIEASSYPDDEAATLDNLKYRQTFAGEYFLCATTPDAETEGDPFGGDHIVGFVCATRCREFTEESMVVHEAAGSILAIHSVVVDASYRRRGVASAMLKEYLNRVRRHSSLAAGAGTKGFARILLLAKKHLLSFYVDCGFMVLRPSPIVHGKETWYELETRHDHLEKLLPPASALGSSRSTSNPDEGVTYGRDLTEGRHRRRAKLHAELLKLDIDPLEIGNRPELFGTAATRTYNSFVMPKSAGALAVAESMTRARVVANNISFLIREFRADQEAWLRNVDRSGDEVGNRTGGVAKHPIVIVLDNVRSAHNVGNILRLAEAAQVKAVRLCGMTPRPPHPKVMKTAMGTAEYVSLGDETAVTTSSTLKTVLDLRSKGYRIYGVETTENATTLWDVPVPSTPIAFVFGNELIGIDVDVLSECHDIVSLPTYGMKNSLNIASCVAIVIWDTVRRLAR